MILLNEAHERGDAGAFPRDLQPGAASIQQATQRLVSAAQEHAASSQDEVRLLVTRATTVLTECKGAQAKTMNRVIVESTVTSTQDYKCRVVEKN